MLKQVRGFFERRGVLEVETPLLSNAGGTDPNINLFCSTLSDPTYEGGALFLNSSPEFSMKRLLAAGSGSIYQVCKAFRNGESGRNHNPEFTILEWYRSGFELSQLIDEVEALITALIGERVSGITERVSYSEVFLRETGVDPLQAEVQEFSHCAREHNLDEADVLCGEERGLWLDFIFSHLVQPRLGKERLCFVDRFPACQASLAQLNRENPAVADRVELFVNGVELGNGFHELTNWQEQKQRFDQEMAERHKLGLPCIEVDERFLAALRHGMPDCSGIAIGLDRLLMIKLGVDSIDQVLAFPIERA